MMLNFATTKFHFVQSLINFLKNFLIFGVNENLIKLIEIEA